MVQLIGLSGDFGLLIKMEASDSSQVAAAQTEERSIDLMALTQLVYVSKPFGFDEAMLNGILLDARRNNPPDDITGALICRADMYLQLLEGPEAAVKATFARIAQDDRHVEVNRLVDKPITKRLFAQWAMRDDPARSWMWTQAEVADGAVARASEEEILGVFERLLSEPVETSGPAHH